MVQAEYTSFKNKLLAYPIMVINYRKDGLYMLTIYLRINKKKYPELYDKLSSMSSGAERNEYVRQALKFYIEASQNINQPEEDQPSTQKILEKIEQIEESIKKIENYIFNIDSFSPVPERLNNEDDTPSEELDPFRKKLLKGIEEILNMHPQKGG